MKKANRKAFTLTELLVVIAIIGILAAVLIPSITGYIKDAKISNQVSNATNMSKELAAYVVANDIDESLSTPTVISLVEEWGYSLDAGIDGYSFWYDASKNRIHFSKTNEMLTQGNRAILAAGSTDLVREVETLNLNRLNLRFIDQSDTIYRNLIDTIYNLPSLGNNNAQGMDKYLGDMISKLSNSSADTIVKNFFEQYKTTETAYISINGSFIYAGNLENDSTINRVIIEKGTTKIEKITELSSISLSISEAVIIPESVTDITDKALGNTKLEVVASTVIEHAKVAAISTKATVVKAQASIISQVVDMDENDYTISYQEKMVKLTTGEEKKLNISDPIPSEWKNLVDSIYYIPKVTLINKTGKFNDVDMRKTNFSSHIDGDKVDYKLLLVDSNYVVYRLNNIAYLTDLDVSLYNSGQRYETVESMSEKQISLKLPKDFKDLANYKNTKLVIEYKVGFAEYKEEQINFTSPYYVMTDDVKYDTTNYQTEVSYQDLCEKTLISLNISDKKITTNSGEKAANTILIQNIKLIDDKNQTLVEKTKNILCINYYDESGNLINTEYCPNGTSYFSQDYQNEEIKEHYHRVWRSMDNENIYYEIGKFSSVSNELNLQYSWEIDKYYITYYTHKNSWSISKPDIKIGSYTRSVLYPYGTKISDTYPAENPSIRGIDFIGWDVEEDAILTENTVVLAKFAEPEYKLVLHLNYEGAEEATETYPIQETGITSASSYQINNLGIYTFNFTVNNAHHYTKINYSPVREGYYLDYWCYFPEGSTNSYYKFTTGSEKQLNVFGGTYPTNVTDNTFNLYAIWKEGKQEVSIKLDFGENAEPIVLTGLKRGVTLKYLDYVDYLPNLEGKVIKKWIKNDETKERSELYQPDEGDVFHAVWGEPKTVTVDWNYDGCPAPTSLDGWYKDQYCYYNSTTLDNIVSRLSRLKVDLPIREGYKLLGISKTADATSPSSSIKVSDNITVYAIWAEITSVKLNLNYEGCASPTIIDNLYRGQKISITQSSYSQYYPTREGYVFRGWSTDKNASSGSSSVKASSDGVEYFGIWTKAVAVTFDYVLNGLPENEECTHYDGYTGYHSPSGVIGYTFMGWTRDLNNPGDLNKKVVFKDGITYYAVWEYTIVKE